ncbi:MAG: hypothetical protein WKG07_41540 [Hymenobacter sp.]
MRDTLPHIEVGRPSMQGLEPNHRPTDVPPGLVAEPSVALTTAAHAAPTLPKLPSLANRLPGLRDVGAPTPATPTQNSELKTRNQKPWPARCRPSPPNCCKPCGSS